MAQEAYVGLLPPVKFTPEDMLAAQQHLNHYQHAFEQRFEQSHSHSMHLGTYYASPQPQHPPAWTQNMLYPPHPPYQYYRDSREEERLLKLEKRKENNRRSARKSVMLRKAKEKVVASKAVACLDQNDSIRKHILLLNQRLKGIHEQNNALRKQLNQPISANNPYEPNLPPKVLFPDHVIFRMDKVKELDLIKEVLLSNSNSSHDQILEDLETDFQIRHLGKKQKLV